MLKQFQFGQRFYESTIGFNRLLTGLDAFINFTERTQYPPVNIRKLDAGPKDGDVYLLELALAGFSKDDIEITLKDNVLSISGKIADEDNSDGNYYWRGIATRYFSKSFRVNDTVEVEKAEMKDGILTISLIERIPEEKQLKRIHIQ